MKKIFIWIIVAILQAFFGCIAIVGAAVAMFGDTAILQFWGAVILIISSLISSFIFVKGWGKSIE